MASALSSQVIRVITLPLIPPSALMRLIAASTPARDSGKGVALAVSVIWPIYMSLIDFPSSTALLALSLHPASSNESAIAQRAAGKGLVHCIGISPQAG
ncbi:hypothetical protein [Sphingobium sp. Ant17]|uniref:hypothetical protein n=1 Tax=Sphingobium sp. Ant17 TaxID=1461752 RepID=UPI001F17ED90|nr:hypothetical protein [Sphingobium sp. Ant17]